MPEIYVAKYEKIYCKVVTLTHCGIILTKVMPI